MIVTHLVTKCVRCVQFRGENCTIPTTKELQTSYIFVHSFKVFKTLPVRGGLTGDEGANEGARHQDWPATGYGDVSRSPPPPHRSQPPADFGRRRSLGVGLVD